jgi:hypothetical protein
MNSAKLFIYYASYGYFLAAPLLLWLLLRKQGWFTGRVMKVLLACIFTGISVLAYARFIEPRLLVVKEHEVQLCTAGEEGLLTAAVFADTHNGLFAHAMGYEKIVRELEKISPDLVLIPGDFTYYLPPEQMPDTYGPLARLEAPVYAVMGNHDVGMPGPDLSAPLTQTLKGLGVEVLNPGEALFEKNGLQLAIVGAEDHWARLKAGRLVPEFKAQQVAAPVIYLQHNPDYIEEVRNIGRFDLMVTGHTHGGQINLPVITCAWTFACDVQRYGYREHPRGNIFVTSGTGMVGLPMRFNVPPVIDVLRLDLKNCAD